MAVTITGSIVTNSGRDILNKVTSPGGTLSISRAAVGNGAAPADAHNLTDLVAAVMDASFTRYTSQTGGLPVVTVQLDSTMVATAFDITEVGIYALDPETSDETLFAYVGLHEHPAYIYADTDVINNIAVFDVVLEVENMPPVSITIDPSALVTQWQLASKADKTVPAAAGNLSGLDADGNLQDTGIAASSVASSADITAINASLANKVNANHNGFPISNDLNDALIPGTYVLGEKSEYQNYPPGASSWSLLDVAGGPVYYRQVLYAMPGGPNEFMRIRNEHGGWSSWKRLAIAEPPLKYLIPLADGWERVNAGEYWKTQEGVVIVTFRIGRIDGYTIPAGYYHIGTLPIGFRPVDYIPHAAIHTWNSVVPGWVDWEGRVCVDVSQDEALQAITLAGTITFLA